MQNIYSLSNITLVTPDKVHRDQSVKVEQKRIAAIGAKAKFDISSADGDLFLYPGLINVHDHLRGDYLPRVGPKPGNYYLNWAPWDNDLKSSEVYKERAAITIEQNYFLGAYKNLFSGVVTVNDHFPHEFNEEFIPVLPIRVIQNYTLAHECSSYDLKWGDGIEAEHARAVKNNCPFITHLEEGFDEEAQRGIEILEELHCLDDYDILIHCIGFSDEDIKKTKKAGAAVGWCPASNIFMFNLTCKIRKILEAGIPVSLGTDSTHTGSVNLLEEMRFARKTYRRMYGEDLPAHTLVQMVTANPAAAFRMQDKIGSVEEGKLADLLLIKPRDNDPYEALVNAEMKDIELLIQEGRPIYGSVKYEELFAGSSDYTQLSVGGREMLVKGDPAALLAGIRKAVGFKKVLDYLPFDV